MILEQYNCSFSVIVMMLSVSRVVYKKRQLKTLPLSDSTICDV